MFIPYIMACMHAGHVHATYMAAWIWQHYPVQVTQSTLQYILIMNIVIVLK